MADGRIVDVVYRKPTPDEYPPDYEHEIVITESTRHGRAKRHTFVIFDAQASGPQRWRRKPAPMSFKKLDRVHRAGYGTNDRPIDIAEHGLATVPLAVTEHLADGVDVAAAVLAVILDALASQAHHQIDLADIKVIVSQLGSHITRLDALAAEQRRHAEAALYTEILRRCTTVEPVSDD